MTSSISSGSMPEIGDLYIGVEMLLPRGDQMARDHVVATSRDADGNVMVRSHTYLTLDTRTHRVEFTGDELQNYRPMSLQSLCMPNAI